MTTVRLFDAVCFDCDSTLSTIEGIDELARRAGVEAEIAPLTAAAMDGSVPLDEVYGRRLAIVRPDKAAIEWLGRGYIDSIVPGSKEAVGALQHAGVAVFIVSGGLLPAILPLADHLGIARDRVHAVDVTFKSDGTYADFDRNSPLSRPDGKAEICRMLAQQYKTIAMVGDGVTDVAASAAGAFVIGFGGVVAREAVRATADVFISDPSLAATLDVLLRRGPHPPEVGSKA